MTTSQLEHLRLLDAHLTKLLADAERRTPGRWTGDGRYIGTPNHMSWIGECRDQNMNWSNSQKSNGNSTFIASCAGNAEAGWRATKAAITKLIYIYDATEGYADGAPDASDHDKLCNEVASLAKTTLKYILAAWPIERLKP